MRTAKRRSGKEGKEGWKKVERAARPFIRVEERKERKDGRK